MSDSPDPIDPARCPLCGGANQCAMERERVSGRAQPSCWCTRVRIAPVLRARLPASARGLACICPVCAGEHPADG